MPRPAAPSPTKAAFTRLQEILGRGAGPDRMPREVEAIVIRLREQGDADQVQEWLEELRDGFAENVGPAYEAIEEIESSQKAARLHAEKAARAMEAARDAFGRALAA